MYLYISSSWILNTLPNNISPKGNLIKVDLITVSHIDLQRSATPTKSYTSLLTLDKYFYGRVFKGFKDELDSLDPLERRENSPE